MMPEVFKVENKRSLEAQKQLQWRFEAPFFLITKIQTLLVATPPGPHLSVTKLKEMELVLSDLAEKRPRVE